MNCSHLLRAPCDKWVCDFPYEFSGIVDGFMLRRMRSNCVRASCVFLFLFFFFFFLHGHLAKRRAKPHGDCAEIVRKSCNSGAVAVQTPKIPHGNCTALVCWLRTEAVRRWCGDCARAVRSKYVFFSPNDHLKSCNFRKISARPPQDAHTMLLRHVYGPTIFFFKFVISSH